MSKSKRSITQFTYDIEEFIDRLQELVNKKSYEEFANDELSIAFVERNLEKIGEAIGQIQKLDENILYLAYDNKGFWEKIKGMRALCQIVLVEKTNKFSSNSSDFRWSYFVANKLLLIKILALK